MFVPSRSQSRLARPILAVLAAFLLTFSFGAATASAVPAPNQTVVTVDPGLALGLKLAGIKVAPKGAATSGSAGIYYPVVNAAGVTDAFTGLTKHQGGFELQIGKALRLGFRNLQVQANADKTGVVTAEPTLFGNGLGFRIPFSKIAVTSVEVRSPGVVAKYKLTFDETLVSLVNKFFHISLIKPGQAWATAETRIARTPATPTPTPLPTHAATTPAL